MNEQWTKTLSFPKICAQICHVLLYFSFGLSFGISLFLALELALELALIGNYKDKTMVNHLILNIANEFKVVVKIRWRIEKLVEVCYCYSEAQTEGFLFSTLNGDLADLAENNFVIQKYLQNVLEYNNVNPEDDVIDFM